jgi:hypothetical protein
MDVAQALLARRPLKREVEPVVAEWEPAVERLVGAGLHVHARPLERGPLPALPKACERRQPARFEHALHQRKACRIEADAGQHGAAR